MDTNTVVTESRKGSEAGIIRSRKNEEPDY